MSAATTKRSVWWHPAYVTPDGRRYCEANRIDAARLIREHKAARTLETVKDIYGRQYYRLLSFDRRHVSGYFCISKATGEQA